ncbi:hypothetical protein PPERSA_10263 [Pseudocohnilembus persalinus]|uniref:Uncharacterized protein n=1 Tax=Pseudocohnilembus persalinus TaxID=266149 RepID=A0A0V0R036_PSEPJ|nr:hypothetical protein PPERSA_10263 [Pseudocohnilembus persalinus]|eukprot:KRX07875.1 hypothetical protein PPERSA_10263 [Pseudocohnilembus persalinus]
MNYSNLTIDIPRTVYEKRQAKSKANQTQVNQVSALKQNLQKQNQTKKKTNSYQVGQEQSNKPIIQKKKRQSEQIQKQLINSSPQQQDNNLDKNALTQNDKIEQKPKYNIEDEIINENLQISTQKYNKQNNKNINNCNLNQSIKNQEDIYIDIDNQSDIQNKSSIIDIPLENIPQNQEQMISYLKDNQNHISQIQQEKNKFLEESYLVLKNNQNDWSNNNIIVQNYSKIYDKESSLNEDLSQTNRPLFNQINKSSNNTIIKGSKQDIDNTFFA